MADGQKKVAGPTNKEAEVKKEGEAKKEAEVIKKVTPNEPTSKEGDAKKVIFNGPTSKQAFRKVEEESRARLAKQRKAEEEWLQKLIQKEEYRRRRIQKILTKEEEQKTAQRAIADNKSVDDAQRNLLKNLEAEQRQIRAEQISTQMKRVKALQINQVLDRINDETECATSRRRDFTPAGPANGENQEPGKEG